MRILLLVDVLSVGGLPNYVLNLARELSGCGDDVAVAYGGPDVPSNLDATGVQLLPLPQREAVAAAHCLRQWHPDVVHVHLCSDPILLEALRLLKRPLLRSFHDYTSLCMRRGRRRWPGDRCQRALGLGCVLQGCVLGPPQAGSAWPSWQSLPAKMAERQGYQSYDCSVVGSHYMRKALLTNGFAPDRVHLVPYFSRFGAPEHGHAQLAPKPGGVPGIERPMQFLFAGQAVAGKGLRVLVRALAALPQDRNWQLTVVSDGPELAPAKALAQRLGIDGRILFAGWLPQSELDGVYRQADLLVLPSVWDDPGPLVGIEALSVGTPVLGFPVGGIPDYTVDGHTGLLVPEVSVKALTATLLVALEKGELLAGMGEAGRAWVGARHGRAQHIELLRRLYGQALEQRAGRPAPAMAAAA
ncbi:MAG TPA: glycosyltransferase family 4 protein [Ramlibacter sp.]|nr:glycosyltransferase family 4 protein [Ramlibacter sp.]